MSINGIADLSRARIPAAARHFVATVVAYSAFIVSFAFAAAMIFGLVP